jgi:hypothetical protein
MSEDLDKKPTLFEILDRNAQPLARAAIASIRREFPDKTANFSDHQCLKVWLNIVINNFSWIPRECKKQDIFDVLTNDQVVLSGE